MRPGNKSRASAHCCNSEEFRCGTSKLGDSNNLKQLTNAEVEQCVLRGMTRHLRMCLAPVLIPHVHLFSPTTTSRCWKCEPPNRHLTCSPRRCMGLRWEGERNKRFVLGTLRGFHCVPASQNIGRQQATTTLPELLCCCHGPTQTNVAPMPLEFGLRGHGRRSPSARTSGVWRPRRSNPWHSIEAGRSTLQSRGHVGFVVQCAACPMQPMPSQATVQGIGAT